MSDGLSKSQPDGDYYEDDYYERDVDDDERDELEEAMDECGLLPEHLGGGCTLGGTEHCDFDCPFRDKPGLFYGEDDGDE